MVGFREEGWVYIIQCENFPYFKVGVSEKSPQERLLSMQVGVPFNLKLIGQFWVNDRYAVEYEIHQKYADRIQKGEWYCLDALSLTVLLADLTDASIDKSGIQRPQAERVT